MTPLYIDTQEALDALYTKIENSPFLALDTEFFRETTYYPKLCLVQIATDDLIACIDPIVFDARAGLKKILLNKNTTKIIHSCSQDLEVLHLYMDALPCPIIDTQIAAAFCGNQDQIGYAKLVEQLFGVQLDKTQTRTNWVKRPLTDKQIEYAADDVRYLIPMYQKLKDELTKLNRDYWLDADCDALCQKEPQLPELKTIWKRVKGTNKLSVNELIIVDAVAQWRELLAREKNLTRKRALSDEIIIDLAKQNGNTDFDKRKLKLSDKEYNSLIKSIENYNDTDVEEWQARNIIRPSKEQRDQVKSLMSVVNERAEQLGISPALLCSRKEIEKMVRNNTEIPVLSSWRLEEIGKRLLSDYKTIPEIQVDSH